MAVSAGSPRPAAATFPPIPLRRRLYGFGSIYGKTIRDSRLAFIIAAGLLGGMALVMGVAISSVFPTPASRLEVDKLIGSMPASMVNLFGKPEKLGTLGGYMSWKYGAIFALGTALWSILALSSTLAGEARRGSLDFVAAAPFGKRRIALEKLAAHLTMLGLAMAILAVATTVSSNLFGDAALGDPIPPLSAVGFALWVGFIALFFGGLAFALAPLLGRSGAAGVAGLAMIVLWVANGLDVLGPVAALSPFRWTADHIALVGEYDWAGLALVGVVAVVFLAIGVELFTRRDLGVTAGLSLPGLPAAVLGVRGPISRAFGDQLPRALVVGDRPRPHGRAPRVAGRADGGPDREQPRPAARLRHDLPGLRPRVGRRLPPALRAAVLHRGRVRRRDVRLEVGVGRDRRPSRDGPRDPDGARPLGDRRRHRRDPGGRRDDRRCSRSGSGSARHPAASAPPTPMLGSAALGLYAVAIVGIGFAVGGLWRTSLAAEIAALVVVATYLIDLLAPALKLPDWVHQLALTAHLGQPMIGAWDPVGIGLCLVIAIGGILLGAWGMARRDLTD